MPSLPDGAKTSRKILVKGLLLHSQGAVLGLWKGLILLSTEPSLHSYLLVSLLHSGVCFSQKHMVQIPDVVKASRT